MSRVEVSNEIAEDGENKPCRLILRFLNPTSSYEMMVSKIVSSPVHVDIVLDKPGTPNRRVCFSAYMNEKFSMTLMPREMVHNDNYENYSVDISEEDFGRCSKYLSGMVDKIPYNYSDAFLLMPTLSQSNSFASVMVQVYTHIYICWIG